MSSSDGNSETGARALNGPRPATLLGRVPHGIVVPLLLIVAASLAVTSLLGDSITFDETGHLTAGFSYLQTGDFRVQPEHPPLPNMFAALPLLLMDHNWPPHTAPGWRNGDYWTLGQVWLFELADGERLLAAARCMRVILLLVTCVLIYIVARRLFGRDAGLLALVLAVLSPTLLAHGRLVTSDLPAALGITLALLALAMLLERITWGRLVLGAAAAAVLPLVKFSWLLALPALLLMVVVAIVRHRPATFELRRAAGCDEPTAITTRPRRAAVYCVLVALLALIGWAAIWSCYGWRFGAFSGPDRDVGMFTAMPTGPGQTPPATREQAWEAVLKQDEDEPVRGTLLGFIGLAREYKLLPEAYLYGLALTLQFTSSQRPGYLNGKIYRGGRAAYFPTAFALKTPTPTLLLLLLAAAAIVFRRAPLGRDPVLLVGLSAFAAIFAITSITSEINIGHRHLVAFYPVIFVLAGAAAAWLSQRVGQVVIVAAIAWAAFATLRAHPNYLCYFNELAGGPTGGYRYLADSNADWGQNLKRLARYAADHPHERIKLAYFGSANPQRYGFECEPLPSYLPFGEPGELTAGTYVISINYLIGLCDTVASDEAWRDERTRQRYRQLYQQFERPNSDAAAELAPHRRLLARQGYQRLRWGRLLHQLLRLTPDKRIGNSLWVYRLTQDDIVRLTAP